MTAKTMPNYVEVVDQCQGVVCASRGNQLSEVYGRYSTAKAHAWERCERICAELDGTNLCITSNNRYAFSAQIEFVSPENGRPMVCHITPTRTYAMYLDMRNIERAKFEWGEYVYQTSCVTYTVQYWMSDDCKCEITWVGTNAYISACGEVYRVINPFKSNGGLRKRVDLQRVGAVDDDVIDCIIQHGDHQAVCGTIPCLVRIVEEGLNRCVAYAYFVPEPHELDTISAVADAASVVTSSLAATVAMCVDACYTIYGFDADGERIMLWRSYEG